MASDPIETRLLTPANAVPFREIRLEALRCAPEAFGSTFEAENARPVAWFSERLGSSNVFGAFRDGELVGVAGLLIREGPKDAHKGLLWGMYVRPASRKSGVGRRLVQTILDFARHRIEQVQLAVVSNNEEARRLYASLGFVEYGMEKKALKQGDQYYDEVLMAKDLESN